MISRKKPHIFKDRHGVWRVIPERCPMTWWEKFCDDEWIHIFALAIHCDYDRYFAQSNRKDWNGFAEAVAYEWNKG